MIVGQRQHIASYEAVIPYSVKIKNYLNDSRKIEYGEWLNIDERLRVIRLNTWNKENKWFESHEEFADLHFICSGADRVRLFVEEMQPLQIVQPYNLEKDYTLYSVVANVDIILRKNFWIFIPPGIPHRNDFESNDTEKLVFKIKIK